MEFAKEYTYDPLITWTVQTHFVVICQRRMKNMVSKAHVLHVQHTWISETIWTEMCTYWDIDEAIPRSHTTSDARNSVRGGLGPHKNFTRQKSFQQIHQEMEGAEDRIDV